MLPKVGTWRDGWRKKIQALPDVGTWRDGRRREIEALPKVGTWKDGRKGLKCFQRWGHGEIDGKMD